MSSKRAKTKTTKKRPQRAMSNAFAMFDQSQIQEFKEAFNMIDQNRDGFIDKEDLHDMLASMGKNPTDAYLDAMMNKAPGPINFTMFLTMFGEKLNGTDPEDVIRNAFACFDEEAMGTIQEDYLRELLTTTGDRFTDEESDGLYREAPIDKKGNFNYIEFTRILSTEQKTKTTEELRFPAKCPCCHWGISEIFLLEPVACPRLTVFCFSCFVFILSHFGPHVPLSSDWKWYFLSLSDENVR